MARLMLGCALVLVARTAAAAAAQTPPVPNSCVACHTTLTDQRLSTPAALFAGTDVHRDRGFECVDCHGGNPTSDDKGRAHDVVGRESAMAFRGKPAGPAVIATCARCHSDAEIMRAFAPKQRVDQATEYSTSVHGKRLAAGDTRVATCASCHGAHGIRQVADAKAPVFPTNVATTCAKCHADPKHMAGYKLADGSPLPTGQFGDYQRSVHYAALTKGNDLSAPTCNDCHGNHGAAPPGVGSMANVCGTCHVVFAQRFETSVHQPIFDKECVECHSNHAVLKPSDELLAAAGPGLCAPCHSSTDKSDRGAAAADSMRARIQELKSSLDRSHALMARIKNAGIDVSDQELTLREAGTKMTLARTEMHAFNPDRVSSIIGDGLAMVATVDQAGQKDLAELRYRRRGLAASLGAILLVVIGLALKVRQIDQRSPDTNLVDPRPDGAAKSHL